MRHRLPLILLACLTALLSAPAAHAASGFTASYLAIPGDGGTPLRAFVITPTGPGPFPLLVMPSSWGAPDLEYVGAGAKLAYQSGYEVVSYSSRGFYDSGGQIDVAGPQTMADVSDVIDWALANTPADPNEIGVAGISYGGGQSLLALAQDPRIKAVAAMDTWTDLAASLYPNQTVSSAGADALLAIGNLTGRPGPDLQQIEKDYAAGDIADILPYTPIRSAVTKIDAINARHPAVMIANDWEDSLFPPAQLVSFFNQLTGPKRIMLEPGDHATASVPGALGLPDDVWDSATLWFDHYLKGIPNGIDTQASVQLKPANGGAWHGYPDWTAATASGTTYYLSGSGFASGPESGWSHRILAGVDTIADSGIPLLSGALQGYANIPVGVAIPLVARGVAGVWSGPAYAGATSLTGAPHLHTTVTPSSPNTSLFAYLYDVNPLGIGSLITDTPNSLLNSVPGKPITLDVDLQPISWTVPAGDHLALVVDTVDPRYTSVSTVGSTVTFTSAAGDPSWLRITGS
ncbi:MAG TPA: alpha/beta fold hydrolase [Pseudonocardiaceae bacterium]|nr:alpha/beta fold hydrolase [Pseudonocardiaceae bacterium]